MKTSESRTEVFKAFISAQSSFSKVLKEKNNPFFHSKYADLAAYLNVCNPALKENDLGLIQDMKSEMVDGQIKLSVTTLLVHTSGEWLESEPFNLYSNDLKAQAIGSLSTYARRYSLASTLGMAQEDDDGNDASKTAPKKPAVKKEDAIKKWIDDSLNAPDIDYDSIQEMKATLEKKKVPKAMIAYFTGESNKVMEAIEGEIELSTALQEAQK